MIKLFLSHKIGGSNVVPAQKNYYLAKATVGQSAIFIEADGEQGSYQTSKVKQIVVLAGDVTVETQNTVYCFTEEATE